MLLFGALLALAAVRSRRVPSIAEQDPPLAYRIAYRVDEPGRPTRLQQIIVRRPFDGREEVSEADGSSSEGLVTTIDHAWRLADGRAVEDLGPKLPSTASGDARPLVAMALAIRHGLAEHAGTARIAGTASTRYAVASPLGRPLGPPGPVSRTELCVDERGLVLEERWTSGRTVRRLRRAIDMELEPSLADEVFLAGPAPSPAAAPGLRFRPPLGFRLAWRSDAVEAWALGPDVLIAEESAGAAVPSSVHAIEVPEGELVLDLVASSVRRVRDGRWLKVSGTVPPAALRAAAATFDP